MIEQSRGSAIKFHLRMIDIVVSPLLTGIKSAASMGKLRHVSHLSSCVLTQPACVFALPPDGTLSKSVGELGALLYLATISSRGITNVP